MKLPITRALRLPFLLLAALVLQGCVTETTGGFNAKKSPEDALRDYLQLASGYLEQNDIAKSKQHLANAVAIDADNSEVHAIWGLVYAREGEPALADQSFQRSLRSNPANSKARNNYAAFLFAEGRFEDAYRELEKVVEDTRYEARPQAFENLGLAALRLSRPVDAETAFNRALQLNQNQLRSALELASLLLAKAELTQAASQYRNYQTLLQLYRLPHTARSLWIGIQVEAAIGNKSNVANLGLLLETNFAASNEYQLYRQLVDAPK